MLPSFLRLTTLHCKRSKKANQDSSRYFREALLLLVTSIIVNRQTPVKSTNLKNFQCVRIIHTNPILGGYKVPGLWLSSTKCGWIRYGTKAPVPS